jgi:selenocysteine lyase/cysteine desulfurase
VHELDCDFLACSAYKFFGPHTGILYGKYDLLDRLTAYKVRPSGQLPPDKFETGTQSFESISGVLGALEYLAWLGTTYGGEFAGQYQDRYSGRKLALKQGMAAIADYELGINAALVEGLSSVPGLHLYGITDRERLHQRVSTFSFTLQGRSPREVAEALAQEQIYVWDGNFYALTVTERLGLEERGGLVRVGAVHYNTYEEIQRLVEVLHKV